jgi:hypothetical protein
MEHFLTTIVEFKISNNMRELWVLMIRQLAFMNEHETKKGEKY